LKHFCIFLGSVKTFSPLYLTFLGCVKTFRRLCLVFSLDV
jgi:hypothetical protein